MAGQAAYEFERFAPPEREPVRVAKNKNVKKRAGNLRWMSKIAVAAVILAMVCSLIYSKAQVTELMGEIQATQTELEQARSTYNYLSSELDERSSLNNIEQQATALGLMKMDKNQITYVQLGAAGRIELRESGTQKVMDGMSAGLLSLFDYLAP